MSADRAPRCGLTPDQHASYRSNGYLLLPRRVPGSFLSAVQSVLEELVDDDIARWFEAGPTGEPCVDEPFGHRYHAAWRAAGRPAAPAPTPDERFFVRAQNHLLHEDWLLALAAEVLGVDRVTPLPSSFFRAKFPDDPSTSLPWHQDAPCVAPLTGLRFVTAWIPLVDVSEASSCLEISPIGPEAATFATAWSERTGYVCMRDEDSERLPNVQPMRMHRGDVLLMSPYLPHRTLENTGDQIRWSVDLRFGA